MAFVALRLASHWGSHGFGPLLRPALVPVGERPVLITVAVVSAARKVTPTPAHRCTCAGTCGWWRCGSELEPHTCQTELTRGPISQAREPPPGRVAWRTHAPSAGKREALLGEPRGQRASPWPHSVRGEAGRGSQEQRQPQLLAPRGVRIRQAASGGVSIPGHPRPGLCWRTLLGLGAQHPDLPSWGPKDQLGQ